MKSHNAQRATYAFVLVSVLMMLAGCDWFKKNESKSDTSSASGDVLMTIDGAPALTAQEYEEQLALACKANPQIEMFIQMMPNAEREYVFRGMATARLIKAWAEKEGIPSTEKFVQERKHLHDAIDLQLYMKYFDEAYPINVTDSDVQKYYEEKKDVIPGLAISQGGVESSFVRFESKSKAQDFFDKVKDVKKADSFKKIAEDAKQQVGQSVINAKSPFGDAIKTAVLETKKYPSVQMVKAGEDAYWVIFASGKTEAKYHDIKSPQVQQGLRKMISDERKEKQLEEVVEKLKTEMNVVENGKYFEDKEAKKRAMSENSQSSDESEEDDMSGKNSVKV